MPAIELLELSEKEKKTAEFLGRLDFPHNYDLFMILPIRLIKQWVYGLDPKAAIVVTCSLDFKKLLGYKTSQGTFGKLADWVARRIHGIDF